MTRARPREAEADTPVAVIGMAGRASCAPDLAALWRLVDSGRTTITDVPADRLPGFDSERLGVSVPRAGLLDRIDTFDADFFGVSPRQAAYMDPRQRMLLEETWHAFEDAAIPPDTLAGSNTGVIVGSSGADYRLRCDGLGAIDQYSAPGTMDTFLANRISYQFDLRGCSVLVDTACSAGLTAVVQAAWALAAGQVDMAVAAGVNVICHGFDQEAYLKAGVLSPSGRVRSFSKEADGYVRGDGVAVVILKRLEDAERDGDPVRAVIRGVAQGHDGRAGGQFSPDSDVQAELIRRAAAKAGVAPGSLGYLEAHATGTGLGDRAEATGMLRALETESAAAGPQGRLWVGALKPVIGHTEGAAGLFGLIKAVLVLEHERIPAIPGFSRLRPDIDLGTVPLAFPPESVAWPREAGRPRLAGVSSFGLGGAGAHVVVSDAEPAARAERADGPGARMFPLSAATPQALAKLATEFSDWLRGHQEADLGPVAWTLQAGRCALGHRAVLTGPDTAAVASAAADLGRGTDPGRVPDDAGPLARTTAEAFEAGQKADWPALWDGRAGVRRTRLISYPFEEQSHWLRAERPPAPLPARSEEPAPATALVHLLPPEAYGTAGTRADNAAAPGVAVPSSPEAATAEQEKAATSERPAPTPPVSEAATPPERPAPTPPVSEAATPPEQLEPTPPVSQTATPPGQDTADAAALEQAITAAVCEVLYLEAGEMDADRDFVAAGLDSVLAVEFVQLLNARCESGLSVEQVYQTRTARALARVLAGPAARAARPAAEPVAAAAPGSADPPPGDLVRRLRELAGECLYMPPDEVDPDADFSDIGLDSVLAVEFVAKLNLACGTDLTLATLHEQSTLSRLAVVLQTGAVQPAGGPR